MGVWDRHVPTSIFKMETNKDLLCGTWNSAQCYVVAWMGGESGGEWILVYVKQTTWKDLLYSTWNSAQCYVVAWMGGEFGEGWIHVRV